ncbi:hypothetical protein, partial [Citrobacter freundii]|uniref:hypothetical protein n=1 Tax=Citrobacter freundii TaxID=546 RepID=UPI0019533D6E
SRDDSEMKKARRRTTRQVEVSHLAQGVYLDPVTPNTLRPCPDNAISDCSSSPHAMPHGEARRAACR